MGFINAFSVQVITTIPTKYDIVSIYRFDRRFLFLLQVITTIPTHRLPAKLCSWGASTAKEIEMEETDLEMRDGIGGLDDHVGRRGQILWVRGLTRLQQQVGALCMICRSLLSHKHSVRYKTRLIHTFFRHKFLYNSVWILLH